jgi:hypothetical protein
MPDTLTDAAARGPAAPSQGPGESRKAATASRLAIAHDRDAMPGVVLIATAIQARPATLGPQPMVVRKNQDNSTRPFLVFHT